MVGEIDRRKNKRIIRTVRWWRHDYIDKNVWIGNRQILILNFFSKISSRMTCSSQEHSYEVFVGHPPSWNSRDISLLFQLHMDFASIVKGTCKTDTVHTRSCMYTPPFLYPNCQCPRANSLLCRPRQRGDWETFYGGWCWHSRNTKSHRSQRFWSSFF